MTDAARADGATVAEVARAVVGLQAQDANAASLGVRARLAGSTASAVDRARTVDRSIVRVWCMRGTLHLVAAEDARWLVGLLGRVGLKRNRHRVAAFGVDAPEAMPAVRAALAERGPLTRHELAAEVRGRGVRLADDQQMPVHLVARAAMHGYVCEAAPRDGEPAYALIDDWLGPAESPFDRDAALVELARRYLRAHAAAGPEDLAAWSGLGLRDARRAFAGLGGAADQTPPPVPESTSCVRLLPAFDGVLLGHRDRRLTVRPEHARAVLPGGGVLRPTLMIDGIVEGTWRLERGRPAVEPFGSLSDDVQAAVAAESADVVRHRAG